MPKIRVLVVDDAVVMRRIISEAVSQDPELELAGWASNGKLALARIPQVNPDCITLDVEMPEMDGIATVAEIRKTYPRLPVIMFSTLTERGAAKTLEALARGATDYVTKPANVGSVVECIERLSSDLIPKIKAYANPQHPPAKATATSSAIVRKPVRRTFGSRPEIVCIASSTGGPNALTAVIPALPADFPVPIAIVQHMPPMFTDLFAKRLDEVSGLKVREAANGDELMSGKVYIAPGGKHLEILHEGGKRVCRLSDAPPENSCRPAADVLFRSAVRVFGGEILGVVLTGMGQDGLRGCEHIVEAGGTVIAQDQASSVVWGMPGAVAQAGIADQVLPLEQIAPAISARLTSPSTVLRAS